MTSATPYVVYNPIDALFRCSSLLAEIRSADLVHVHTVHGLMNIFGFGTLMGTRTTSKLVVSSHGVPRHNSPVTWLGFQWWSEMTREMGRRARTMTTVAKSSIPKLESLGIPRGKLRYIPNGVDSAIFRRDSSRRDALRRELGISDDEIVVMSLGDLRAAKGVLVFLNAILDILSVSPSVSILIAGGGPLRSLVQQWLTKNNSQISHRVRTILRHIDEHEVPDLFNSCDIFVLPSFWEGLPLTMLEAMACGACTVASAVGDIPYVIHHGDNGLLFHPGDSKDLALCVRELILDSKLRESVRRKAVESMKSFDWDQIADQYYAVYSEITS